MLKRMLEKLRRPTYYVGRDLEGNAFYERPSTSNDSRRTKRSVKYRRPEDMWQYIGGSRRLPMQWHSWLTHTRQDPPTMEELQADVVRQHRIKANAAMIETRDMQERAESLRITAGSGPIMTEGINDDMSASNKETQGSQMVGALPSNLYPDRKTATSESPVNPESHPIAPPSHETQSWTPQTRSRGSW